MNHQNVAKMKRPKSNKAGYIFIAPAVLFFLVFTAIPIVVAVYLSFTRYGVFDAPRWIGLRNYINIFTVDPVFLQSFRNVSVYVAIVVPSVVLISMVVAFMLNNRKDAKVFRSIYYLPALLSIIAASAVWRFMFDPTYGTLNQILRLLGMQSQNLPQWIYHPSTAMASIALMSLWMILGINIVIYSAAVRGIPKEVVEAAEIDGASSMNMFWRIIFPLLRPTTFFVMTMTIIGSFQLYDQIYALTSGGPAGSTTTPVFLIYMNAFDSFNMGYASAQSVILFIVIIVFTLLSQRLTRDDY